MTAGNSILVTLPLCRLQRSQVYLARLTHSSPRVDCLDPEGADCFVSPPQPSVTIVMNWKQIARWTCDVYTYLQQCHAAAQVNVACYQQCMLCTGITVYTFSWPGIAEDVQLCRQHKQASTSCC